MMRLMKKHVRILNYIKAKAKDVEIHDAIVIKLSENSGYTLRQIAPKGKKYKVWEIISWTKNPTTQTYLATRRTLEEALKYVFTEIVMMDEVKKFDKEIHEELFY